MEITDVYLYGASGHARVVADTLLAQGVSVAALVDDDPAVSALDGLPVIHDATGLSPFIISIGDNRARRAVASRLACGFALAVHPRANISPLAMIGEGTVVMAGATVNAGARIGRHCIINTNSSVDHDCVVGDYAHISPNAALCGGVHVGEGAHVGAGAAVIPGVSIGSWAVIGAGATVTADIPGGATAVGTPARLIRRN